MIKNLIIIIFVSIILIILINKIIINNDYILKLSSLDNNEYFVLNYNNNLEAANQLSIINSNINKLISSLNDKIVSKDDISRLKNNYKNNISELEPDSKYTAYSLNKGEKIKICLRDNSNNLINDLNTSMFIICHELSHLMTKQEQHPPIFWNNMKKLLKQSHDIGILKNIDYSKTPVQYGKHFIKINPYYMEDGKYPYIN